MAAIDHAPVVPPAPPLLDDAQLARELADVFHLIAECWSRGLRVPGEFLDQVDELLDRVQQSQVWRGNFA